MHLELADLEESRAYLEAQWPESASYECQEVPLKQKKMRDECPDCKGIKITYNYATKRRLGRVRHYEIFTFHSEASGAYPGAIKLVQGIIETWGRVVKNITSENEG